MTALTIIHQTELHRFVVQDQQQIVAVMTYSPTGDGQLIIDHTEVDPAYGGQGLGHRLVEAAVDFARASGRKIQPLCPFVASVLKQKGEACADVF
ncbi:GNAT family N-acetyltransferase [Crenobacter sp. SG2303]|uniref:GNAT family N-acetyltransferase n=1 Tax=Crenobacter oryzisoli TaxID=3056844 RepID=A0ABT7XJ41_9NEIS|nr:GNAT family N-acetyltransferase [Crenobacter sp. SG2303]MDN0073803.1 GNAT family N-acetyltransferase [Crenobacter sp. SG2303]